MIKSSNGSEGKTHKHEHCILTLSYDCRILLENNLTSLNLSFNHLFILKSLIEKLLRVGATAVLLRVYFCWERTHYAINYTLVTKSHAAKSRYWELREHITHVSYLGKSGKVSIYSLFRFWKI